MFFLLRLLDYLYSLSLVFNLILFVLIQFHFILLSNLFVAVVTSHLYNLLRSRQLLSDELLYLLFFLPHLLRIQRGFLVFRVCVLC